MDKSNHTVTVPREYLELLEEFYEFHQDVNIFGRVLKVMNPPNDYGLPPEEKVLFLNENDITNQESNRIIVLNKEGKEVLRYRLSEKILHD